MTKVELIIHPVRFRILQSLMHAQRTTQEITNHLADIPKSSVYRHLSLLRKNKIVGVVRTQLVNGIEEKVYGLQQTPRLGPNDVVGLSVEEHIRYFTVYSISLLQGFTAYVEQAHKPIDMVADRVGYTEVVVQATKEEFDAFQTAVNQALLPLLQNEAGNGRQAHKFAIVTHPIQTDG